MIKSKRGQVWVETAIYTLIGLTVIAIVLSAAIPQIEKIKDREIIKQTIDALNVLNGKISESETTVGNVRILDFKIAKGRIEINSKGDFIKYTLEDSILELSQAGQEIKEGDITLKTENYGEHYNIYLTMDYADSKLDITYKGKEENKILQAGTTPYKIQIENRGYDPETQKTNINIDVIS